MANYISSPLTALNAVIGIAVGTGIYHLGWNNGVAEEAKIRPSPYDFLSPEDVEAIHALGALWAWIRSISWISKSATFAMEHPTLFTLAMALLMLAIAGAFLRLHFLWHDKIVNRHINDALRGMSQILRNMQTSLMQQEDLLSDTRDAIADQNGTIDNIQHVLMQQLSRQTEASQHAGAPQSHRGVMPLRVGHIEDPEEAEEAAAGIERGFAAMARRVQASLFPSPPTPKVRMPPQPPVNGEEEIIGGGDDDVGTEEDARDQSVSEEEEEEEEHKAEESIASEAEVVEAD